MLRLSRGKMSATEERFGALSLNRCAVCLWTEVTERDVCGKQTFIHVQKSGGGTRFI